MTARPNPRRHWRSYGTDPTGAEALDEPFRAFPSRFLRITCDRCGKDRFVNEAHAPWGDRTLSQILARTRHDGCGGRGAKAELITGIALADWRAAMEARCCRLVRGPDTGWRCEQASNAYVLRTPACEAQHARPSKLR